MFVGFCLISVLIFFLLTNHGYLSGHGLYVQPGTIFQSEQNLT